MLICQENLSNIVPNKGTTYAPVYPMMMNLVVLLNGRSLFGADLSTSLRLLIVHGLWSDFVIV
jgi:hypothetical protein